MSIQSVNPLSLLNTVATTGTKQAEASGSFADVLSDYLKEAEQTQQVTAAQTDALLSGEVNNLHDISIASTEAELTLNLAIAVRNKVIDAYNEVMRMQV